MTCGARPVRGCLLAGLAVLALAGGCAGSPTTTPTAIPTPTPAVATTTPAAATQAPPPSATPTLASATPGPAAVPTPPTAAHRPQTIHVLEDPVDFQTVHVAGCAGDCAGDRLTGHSRLIDAATNEVVGSLAVECVLADPSQKLYHCPANTISLDGRGEIVFDETFYLGGPWYPKAWPIVSGTGEFLGATGSVASPKDSTWAYGDFVITITG